MHLQHDIALNIGDGGLSLSMILCHYHLKGIDECRKFLGIFIMHLDLKRLPCGYKTHKLIAVLSSIAGRRGKICSGRRIDSESLEIYFSV